MQNWKESITYFLNEAARGFDGADAFVQALLTPHRIIEGSIRVPGLEDEVKCTRVQNFLRPGPFKGGVRVRENVSLDLLEALAFVMTIKCALLELPFGGAKGGITVDASEFSASQREAMWREFLKVMKSDIGPDVDVLAPDMGTNAADMETISRLFSLSSRSPYPQAVVTGKPAARSASPHREAATGFGVAQVAQWSSRLIGLKIAECDVAIFGLGNVGQHAARFLVDAGATVIAVCDSRGGAFDPNGLPIEELVQAKEKGQSVHDWVAEKKRGEGHTVEKISCEDVLHLDVDLLILAASEGTVHEKNASDVNAGIVIEGANMAIDYRGDQALRRRGVIVVPDVLANGGGVMASFLEWDREVNRSAADSDRDLDLIKERLFEAWAQTLQLSSLQRVSLREAAYQHAIKQLFRQPAENIERSFYES